MLVVLLVLFRDQWLDRSYLDFVFIDHQLSWNDKWTIKYLLNVWKVGGNSFSKANFKDLLLLATEMNDLLEWYLKQMT